MKKATLLSFLFSLVLKFSIAQVPSIEWQKSLGGSSTDWAYSIIQTQDGGYLVAGESSSSNYNVTNSHGDYDMWIVKLNITGSIQWQKSLGGSYNDYANAAQQTEDGGYIIVGTTFSNNGNVKNNHDTTGFSPDLWIVKLDAIGNISWQKCLGGTLDEWGYDVKQTKDGGYLVAGCTLSNDGDVAGNHDTTGSNYDCWIVKLTDVGTIKWQKCFGGSDDDYVNSICENMDGGYAFAGYTESNNGDVSGNHGITDGWLATLDSLGNLQWQRCLGGSQKDIGYTVRQTPEGGFIIGGNTNSNDGDVSGNFGYYDFWIVKVNPSGVLEWQSCLGGSDGDFLYSLEATADTGFVVAGWTNSFDGLVSGNHGNWDYWMVKLDGYGVMEWQQCLGGSGDDLAQCMTHTSDGGYIVSGMTRSYDGNVTGNHGGADYWVIKLSYPNAVNDLMTGDIPFAIYPTPANSTLNVATRSNHYRNLEVKINTVDGTEVFNSPLTEMQFQIDVSGLSDGVYFITISDLNYGQTVKRFVKL